MVIYNHGNLPKTWQFKLIWKNMYDKGSYGSDTNLVGVILKTNDKPNFSSVALVSF